MSDRDAGGPFPVPSFELIAKVVRRLDGSLLAAGGSGGQDLEDAPMVIAYSSARQKYGDPCGLWLIDRHRVGHVEANRHAKWVAGLLADADGRVLAELENRRRGVVAVVRDDHELASIVVTFSMPTPRKLTHRRTESIELAAPAGSWSLQWRRRKREYAVLDGDMVLASGTASKTELLWRKGEHATAIWLHRDLDVDHRAVVLLALLVKLGPPDAPPA